MSCLNRMTVVIFAALVQASFAGHFQQAGDTSQAKHGGQTTSDFRKGRVMRSENDSGDDSSSAFDESREGLASKAQGSLVSLGVTTSSDPVNCTWSGWGNWGTCHVTCGGGIKMRSRSIAVEAQNGGEDCKGTAAEEEGCNMDGCPIDCVWDDWSVWENCTKSCGGGITLRRRKEKYLAKYGGLVCHDLPGMAGEEYQEEGCEQISCPVDCVWGDWGYFGICSKSCGNGTNYRHRSIAVHEQFGGHHCEGSVNESSQCNTDACAVDCTLSAWTTWSACSKDCGGGVRTRNRTVLEPDHDGGVCPDDEGEEEPCHTEICPVDCLWSEWRAWTPCTVSCDGGMTYRFRTRIQLAAHGGNACPGTWEESKNCHPEACPVDCAWTNWGGWSNCSASCGGGQQKRHRKKEPEAFSGGLDCVGTTDHTAVCNSNGCPVDCTWNVWSSWSNCSKTCDGGTTFRNRTEKTSQAFGGLACNGEPHETKACGTQGCIVHCEMTEWTKWSQCTRWCGGGQTSRTRHVTQQARNGGMNCGDELTQENPCNPDPCPVDCAWNEWGNWSLCTFSCKSFNNVGVRVRGRSIKTNSSYGGSQCNGTAKDEQFCNQQPCPVNCAWEQWEAWGTCSATCGGGIRWRTRAKLSEELGGLPCQGPGNETAECLGIPMDQCPNGTITNKSNTTANVTTSINGSKYVNDTLINQTMNGNATEAASNLTAVGASGGAFGSGVVGNATAYGATNITGSITMTVDDAAGFAASASAETACKKGVSVAAGTPVESITNLNITVKNAGVLVEVVLTDAKAQRAKKTRAGVVEVSFEIDLRKINNSHNASATAITTKLSTLNSTSLTFIFADSFAASGLNYTDEVQSMTATVNYGLETAAPTPSPLGTAASSPSPVVAQSANPVHSSLYTDIPSPAPTPQVAKSEGATPAPTAPSQASRIAAAHMASVSLLVVISMELAFSSS